MDHGRVCREYWKSRPRADVPQHFQSGSSTSDPKHTVMEVPENDITKNPSPQANVGVGVNTVLSGLFKKANLEELYSFHSMLSSDEWSSNQGILIQLLDEEIQKQKN